MHAYYPEKYACMHILELSHACIRIPAVCMHEYLRQYACMKSAARVDHARMVGRFRPKISHAPYPHFFISAISAEQLSFSLNPPLIPLNFLLTSPLTRGIIYM